MTASFGPSAEQAVGQRSLLHRILIQVERLQRIQFPIANRNAVIQKLRFSDSPGPPSTAYVVIKFRIAESALVSCSDCVRGNSTPLPTPAPNPRVYRVTSAYWLTPKSGFDDALDDRYVRYSDSRRARRCQTSCIA